MKIIKRNGSEAVFDITKIIAAIEKANVTVPEEERLTQPQIVDIANSVGKKCLEMRRAASVEEIQEMAESLIMQSGTFDVAKHSIMYAELNTKSDYCQICGFDGEIEIREGDGKLVWACPKCGNRGQNKMNVARRTCGCICDMSYGGRPIERDPVMASSSMPVRTVGASRATSLSSAPAASRTIRFTLIGSLDHCQRTA